MLCHIREKPIIRLGLSTRNNARIRNGKFMNKNSKKALKRLFWVMLVIAVLAVWTNLLLKGKVPSIIDGIICVLLGTGCIIWASFPITSGWRKEWKSKRKAVKDGLEKVV